MAGSTRSVETYRIDVASQGSTHDQRTPFANYYEHAATEDGNCGPPHHPGRTEEEEEGIDSSQAYQRISKSNYEHSSTLGGGLRPELPRDSCLAQYSYQGTTLPNCLGSTFDSRRFSSISATVQVQGGRPVRVHLLFSPTGELLYWDDGMRIGGFFTSSNAVFYPTEKRRSPDHRNPWVEFCFENDAKATIGVRYQDLRFTLCQSSEEASECQTVFRVGPNPSEDDNYVSFEIPSEQSGTSNAKTYYWTNSDDRVAFVTKYEQQVKVFQMRVII